MLRNAVDTKKVEELIVGLCFIGNAINKLNATVESAHEIDEFIEV